MITGTATKFYGTRDNLKRTHGSAESSALPWHMVMRARESVCMAVVIAS
jgi:hypothetical protein